MVGEINFGLLNTDAPAQIVDAFQKGYDRPRLLAQQQQEFALKQRAQEMLNQHYQNEATRIGVEQQQAQTRQALADLQAKRLKQKSGEEANTVSGALGFLFPQGHNLQVQHDDEGDFHIVPAVSWSDIVKPQPIGTDTDASATPTAKPTYQPMQMDMDRAKQLGLNETQAAMIGSLLGNEQTAKFGLNMLGNAFKQSLRPASADKLPQQAQLYQWRNNLPPDEQTKFDAMLSRMHPPTNISLSTEKKYGDAFAGDIAKNDTAMRGAALKAPQLDRKSTRLNSSHT